MAKPQDSTKSKMSRTYWIDQLFDRGEELMEKLGCQVFILVSEDGICSKYMGSEVFLNEFRSCGLKIMEKDVHRISRNIGIQSDSMIADAQEATASQGTEARLMEIATRRDYMRRMKVKTTEDCKNVREKMQQILTESYASKENMCQSCGLSFKNPKRLKLHQKKATCSGRKCHFCGKMFPFKDWKDHLLDDHMEKMKIHECQLCKKQFVLSCNYRSHMRIHKRNGDIIRKETQEQKLESEDDLGNHRVRIQKFFKEFCDSKPNLCERCGYSFRNPHGLEVHKQRASCSGRRCRFCGMSFLYKEWQQHLLESHLAEVKIYKCKLCEKQFMRYPDLYKHVQIHKGKKTSRTCDICGRTLKTETSLATHKLMHEGKEFKCDYCDYKNVRKCDLMVHMQRHLDKSKLQCKECGKQLLNTNSLRKHIQRLHTNFKYQCSDCEKAFSMPWDLRHHVERHHKGDTNLHKCKICKKGFHTKILLNSHVRVFHSDDRVKCQFCGKEYRHHSRLKEHLVVHRKTKVKSAKS